MWASAIAALALVAGIAGCGQGAQPSAAGPFTLRIWNASAHAATLTWTGDVQGRTVVEGCEVGHLGLEDGQWVVTVAGGVAIDRFPLEVATAAGGSRSRTIALDAFGRIDRDARVPGDTLPCPVR